MTKTNENAAWKLLNVYKYELDFNKYQIIPDKYQVISESDTLKCG
jgi:hypothetical protein